MITRPNLWLIVATITVVVSIAIIVLVKPLWGIDFIGGSLLEVQGDNLSTDIITSELATLNLGATIQTTDTGSFLIRTIPLNPTTHDKVTEALKAKSPTFEELRYESIGPTIGEELRRKAWIAIIMSVVVMIAYLAYEFRHMGGLISPWKYGVAATVALVHDLVFVTAIFVILGRTHNVPIDTLFVTAMLAVFGYSANDTIVLFNRMKYEWLGTRTGSLITIMDRSAQAILIRSLNISIAILLTLIILLFFGGPTIYWFIVALTIGTIVGTYSTIFVAPPFLYLLSKKR
ncbi:MAG: protein translocase subunit SecF [Candidatus Andersenbacteria bacterium]